MAMIAAESMGLPLERVTFQLGDSTLPIAPVEGGSSHVTTVGSAVAGACDKLRLTLLRYAQSAPDSPFRDKRLKDVEFAGGVMRLKRDPSTFVALGTIVERSGRGRIEEKYLQLPQMLKAHKYRRLVHSAVFVEVRVDEELGIVRVTRVVNAVAAGRIMNLKTATSQILGGVVWGISQALHEESHIDHRFGRFMNHNLSEYHVAVHADIHDIDVIFVEEDDRIVSRLGAKGVGEIGQVSVAAAVSNAIYHATGKRIRSTPITPDKVLAGGP
jgi:xanthine dehydrogenase YagR molybdenum-binding subunit